MIEKLTFGLFSKEDSHNFMRLMEYVRPYKSRIIFALIAIVVLPRQKVIWLLLSRHW